MLQQPQPIVYLLQKPASYQIQTLVPSMMSYQPQQSGGYQSQASAYQLMSINEDLFTSCMAKVDNEDKRIESENLNSRITDKSGDMDYKIQNSVNKFKDEDQFGEEHSFEKPHEEEAPAVEKEKRPKLV